MARALRLTGRMEWQVWSKELKACAPSPPNAPAAPNQTYKDGGRRGWGHWLGASNQAPCPNPGQLNQLGRSCCAHTQKKAGGAKQFQTCC